MSDTAGAVRIDKWLWAARFFKTRSLAKKAIEGGKVHVQGQRVKVSKQVELGMLVLVRQGWDERAVKIVGLSEQRRSATIAQTLYEETKDSIEKRARLEAERKASKGAIVVHDERPTGKDRRLLEKMRQQTHISDS